MTEPKPIYTTNAALIRPSLGLSIEAVTSWQPMVKNPSVVFVKRLEAEFTVLTDAGPLKAPAGSYVAHDPVTGQFWPLSELYLDLHYRTATQEEVAATAAAAHLNNHDLEEQK